MQSAASASKFARCPSTLGVCEPLVAVQSRQPRQLFEVARRQVDHRRQLGTNRADSQQFVLRLRHLGGGHPLFYVPLALAIAYKLSEDAQVRNEIEALMAFLDTGLRSPHGGLL